jgi:SAM-dependent methyltransferase
VTAPDFESHSGDYGIDECADCSVAFTNPRPIDEDLPKLYAQRDTTDFPRMSSFVQRLRDFTIDRYLAKQLATCRIDDAKEFSALDYGCGDGALVRGLLRFGNRRGRRVRVTAVDFHDGPPPSIADVGPAVTYVPNAAWHQNPGQYDAIFLRHVLEHHSQPLRLLGDLAAALKPNGRLHIEVPNRHSLWAGIFGRYYVGYYLPRHLFHFDRASLAGALKRAGFSEADVRLAQHPMIGGSLGYLIGSASRNTGLMGLACYPLQVGLDKLCGRSTTLLAIAGGHG